MLKIDQAALDQMEQQYPGIEHSVHHYEQATLPACPRCGSEDTAIVSSGIIGHTIAIAAATTKFKLIPNNPKPGSYFCNVCEDFFNKRRGQRQQP